MTSILKMTFFRLIAQQALRHCSASLKIYFCSLTLPLLISCGSKHNSGFADVLPTTSPTVAAQAQQSTTTPAEVPRLVFEHVATSDASVELFLKIQGKSELNLSAAVFSCRNSCPEGTVVNASTGEVRIPLLAASKSTVSMEFQAKLQTGEIVSGSFAVLSAKTTKNCSLDGEVDCLANPSFRAADMALLVPSNVKNGVTIAGQSGTYPSLFNPLPGSSPTKDLTELSASVEAGSYEFWDSSGVRHEGTISDAGNIVPGKHQKDFRASLYRGFMVAGDASLDSEKILSGVTLFGVNGSVTLPGVSDVRAGTTYGPSASLSSGSLSLPVDCATNSAVGCVTTTTYKSANLTNLGAGNIKAGVSIAGVTGTLVTGGPPDCGSDGEIGCVSTSLFKAVDSNILIPANIKSGTTIAGQVGNYPSVINPLTGSSGTDLPSLAASVAAGSYQFFKSDGTRVTGSITDAGSITPTTSNQTLSTSLYRTFTVAGDANLVAAKIVSGNTIFGISGSTAARPADCATNSAVGCVTTSTYQSADLTNLSAGNIKSGVSIAGVSGSVIPSPAPCGSDGEVGCVSTSSFKAVDSSILIPANIKSGTTIAGQVGNYPSVINPLTGSSGTDLPSLAATAAAGSYQFFKSDGTRVTGSITDAGTITPTTSNQTLSTSLYRTFTVAGDANLVAAKIVSGNSIFGVAGSTVAKPADCATNSAVGCVTTSTYQSATSQT